MQKLTAERDPFVYCSTVTVAFPSMDGTRHTLPAGADAVALVQHSCLSKNNQVPQRKLRDRLNPLEFYDEDEFLLRYRCTKETVLELNRKTGSTVKNGSDRDAVFKLPVIWHFFIFSPPKPKILWHVIKKQFNSFQLFVWRKLFYLSLQCGAVYNVP